MPSRNSVYQVAETFKPRRSTFDLSHSTLFDCSAGKLIPIMCDEVVPGDHFNISTEMVIRLNPLVSPALVDLYATVRYFFVPYRILWDKWEEFITGGEKGDFTGRPPIFKDIFPSIINSMKGTTMDYLGLPIPDAGVTLNLTEENSPLLFPWLAYDKIYNEFYRDENLNMPERDIQKNGLIALADVAWNKDYFTSALPFVQRGTVPALPINITGVNIVPNGVMKFKTSTYNGTFVTVGDTGAVIPGTGLNGVPASSVGDEIQYVSGLMASASSASSINSNDIRTMFQVSKFQERNAPGGVRYTEFLRSHFGVHPRDDRLQRPEFIGGSKTPIIISEVLQTSSTDSTTPQGNMAGHGISVDKNHAGKYFVKEYGLIMGLFTLMPRNQYVPQGVNKQWLRRTRFDFYFPEFAHLQEQPVMSHELYLDNDASSVFGYQGRYNEMRSKEDKVHNNMRDTLSYWHMARKFSTRPLLNSSFVYGSPSNRIFAVQNQPEYIVHLGNRVLATRPLPYIPTPGLADHF